MRIELKNTFDGVEELQKLCNKAKTDHFDAVFVPPMFVSTASEMLGRNDITIVTAAGQDDDILGTKLMAMELAARDGAEEVIISLSDHNILDEKWNLLDKELLQIKKMGEIHRVFVWIECRQFSLLNKPTQARMADLLGDLGLRVRGASVDDIKLAELCGIQKFCVDSYNLEPTEIQELVDAGATQFVMDTKPEQLKTTQLKRTEVLL